MSGKIKTIWNKLATGIGKWRLLRLGAVTLLVWSAFIPVFDILFDINLYNLSPQVNAIMGEANTNLSAKFSYNSEKQEWMFNKEGLGLQAEQLAATQNISTSEAGEVVTQLRKQTGGGGKADDNLYSVKLPSKITDGFTYYDNVTNLKFKLIPQDQSYDGKKWGDRLVYPMANGMKAVYTAKSNGLKEDIILTKPVGDEVSFSYDMELPSELEARLESDGSVGIYSANPVLYATTAENSADKAKLQSARETAVKDHLVFGLPKPEIIDAKGVKKPGSFSLAGDTLIVRARGLEKLAYPLSVDPSVVITSSSDFATGNNEGNIAYNASGSISTAATTGGTFNGTWTSQTNINYDGATSHAIPRVAVYNGYLYMINGNHVETATISSSGVIGTWNNLPTNAYTINAHGNGAGLVTYNGYLYVVGGQNANTSVEYAPIDASTGAIGTWASTTSLPAATFAGTVAVMNGYLYLAGGYGGSTLSTVRYAKFNANGTIGTWATTTALPQVRTTGSGFAYNGYLYVGGGYVDETNALYSSVVYAKQNADGTLGSWMTASSMNQAGPGLGMTVVGGYAYAFGGAATTTYGNGSTRAEYAQINADGSLGTWRTNSSMTLTQARTNLGSFSYTNGTDSYVYVLGGRDEASGGYRNTVHSAKIAPAGDNNGWATTTSLPGSRSGGGVIAYNDFLYYVGGSTGPNQSTAQSTVYSAPIGANGTVGAWSTASSAFADGFGHVYFGLAVHNGYMYTIAGSRSGSGGASQISTVQYAAINTDGTLGTWTSTTSASSARRFTSAWAYNGHLYYAGGYHNTSDTVCNTSASNYCNDVWRAPLSSSDGSVGTWVQQASLPDQTANTVALVLRNVVYLIDGESTQCGKIAYSAMDNSTGTLAGWSTYTADDCRTADPMGGVNNGILYTWGGAIASSPVATGKYIWPAADGSVDTVGVPDSGCGSRWCTLSSNLTNTNSRRKGTTYGGYMYTIGGDNGTTAQTTVEYSPIGNGGGGRVGAWTSTATSSPAGSAGAGMSTSGDYVYLTGGADGSTQRNWTAYGQMGADGAVTFTSGTTMTTPRAYHGMASHNGYIYAVGGSTTGWSPQATVEYAQIQSNGSIGAWATTTSMPEARYSGKTVIHNGYIYVIGGGNASSTLQNTVYYAPINSNGTIGTWSSTSTFTNARVNMAAFAYGGYMYMSGGYDGVSAGTYYNDMQYAPINSDGTLGSWSYMSGPGAGAPRAALYMHASDGFVYWGGGSATVDSTNVAFSDMYRAPMLASGQIGAWERTTSLGTGTFAGASTIAKGRLYVYGGRNAGGNTSNLQRAPLDATARVGNYSKLVNLDGQMSNVVVGYNGTLGAGSNVTYAVAPTSGVLGSYSTGTQGTVADPTGVCSADLASSTRYVQVRARIDNSQAAVFAWNNNYSNMSDISVYYGEALRAPTQLRMHGGKWFKNESQQPLDTCSV